MTQSRKRTKKLKPSESFKIDWAMAGIAMGLGSFSQHKIKENEEQIKRIEERVI